MPLTPDRHNLTQSITSNHTASMGSGGGRWMGGDGGGGRWMGGGGRWMGSDGG